MSKQETRQIAETMISQLGGWGRLRAMIGGNTLVYGDDEKGNVFVVFRFKGSRKMNMCRVTLQPSDTYKVEFMRYRKYEAHPVSDHSGIYNDMLIPLFENETGLYLHF